MALTLFYCFYVPSLLDTEGTTCDWVQRSVEVSWVTTPFRCVKSLRSSNMGLCPQQGETPSSTNALSNRGSLCLQHCGNTAPWSMTGGSHSGHPARECIPRNTVLVQTLSFRPSVCMGPALCHGRNPVRSKHSGPWGIGMSLSELRLSTPFPNWPRVTSPSEDLDHISHCKAVSGTN